MVVLIQEYKMFIANKDQIAYMFDMNAKEQAFRTKKDYDNKGYFSKFYKFMEFDLKSKGFERLTLGVELYEVRNSCY